MNMLMLGKTLTWLVSPLTIALFVFVAGLLIRRRKAGRWLCAAAVLWLIVWSTPASSIWLYHSLTKDYPAQSVETLPAVDAIVVLGGGMIEPFTSVIYPEVSPTGNRLWHAARLYKAGKAPVIILTGAGEQEAAVPFLRDLGVPTSAIRLETESRNTEENARFTAAMLARMNARRILLVTSSWHIRRAQWLFAHAGIESIPSVTDYVATMPHVRNQPGHVLRWLPHPETMGENSMMVKEYLGYWTYRMRGYFSRSDL